MTDEQLLEALNAENDELRRLLRVVEKDLEGGVLEQVVAGIVAHDAEHPDHGRGCACHDVHPGKIRRLIASMPQKSRDNLFTVLGYVTRNP